MDADEVEPHGFRVSDPHAPDPAGREAALRQALERMGPPRVYTMGPGGSLVERDAL
ncbi:hypothetical protein ABZY83_18930 [Streptomyces virginiae]|nr:MULTISPECIES: hypothetical protein [unclassified Streptomyces]